MQRPSYRRREFFIDASQVLVAGATREILVLRLPPLPPILPRRSVLSSTHPQMDVTSIGRKKFRPDRRWNCPRWATATSVASGNSHMHDASLPQQRYYELEKHALSNIR